MKYMKPNYIPNKYYNHAKEKEEEKKQKKMQDKK